jgi:hypothetical protein
VLMCARRVSAAVGPASEVFIAGASVEWHDVHFVLPDGGGAGEGSRTVLLRFLMKHQTVDCPRPVLLFFCRFVFLSMRQQ